MFLYVFQFLLLYGIEVNVFRAQNNGRSQVLFSDPFWYVTDQDIFYYVTDQDIFYYTFPMGKPLITYNKVPILNK